MWILRFIYCLLQGHAFIDVTTTNQPYRYCLHCGKVREPVILAADRHMIKNGAGTETSCG
jgi:hypothetical protein